MTVNEIYHAINKIAPFSESMDFDNTGLLIGSDTQNVKTALLCLDVTDDVLEEAKEIGAELIISHHPVIFRPLKRVSGESVVYKAVQSGIAVISAHTNLDKAFPYGVNHALAEALGLNNIRGIIADGGSHIAYMGDLPEAMGSDAFAEKVKSDLKLAAVRYTPAARKIKAVGVVGGSGGDYAAEAFFCGADAFVTGEVKHHEAIEARQLGLALYEAGHYHTEIVYREMLKKILEEKCPGVRFCISQKESAPMEII